MTTVTDIMDSMDYGPAPEGASIVTDWLGQSAEGFGHFIGGAFSGPGLTFEVQAPASGSVLARVTQGTPEDVVAAVGAARTALPAWAALSGHEQARHLYALARHVQQHSRFLAVLESLDNSKPIPESRDVDVPLVTWQFYHHAD